MRARSICVLAVLTGLALANTAHAQDVGALPNGAVLSWDRLFISEDGDPNNLVEVPDAETLRLRLNLGACQCSQNMAAFDTDLYYELSMQPTTNLNLPATVFVGSACDDDIQRVENCHELPSNGLADIDLLSTRPEKIRVPLYDLINARASEAGLACRQANNGAATVYVSVDTDQNGDLDFFSPRPLHLSLFTDVTGFDTQAPPLPTDLTATGGEGTISLAWKIPVTNATDLFAFQAFCKDATGAPVANGITKSPLYATSATICGIPSPLALTSAVLATDEGTEVPVAPPEFENLDPAFLCATQPSGTATSLTIGGLENGMEYTVGLVAVDFYGNPTGAYFSRTIIPKPVTDFWEDLHDRGARIEGGFCAAGGTDGALGLLLPLALAGLIVLRRRRRSAARLAVLALVVAPAVASADDFTPYWEDPNTSADGDGVFEDRVKWRAGIKLGPYTPAIDDQVGVNPRSQLGPYRAMFGNYYTDENNDGILEAHDARVYQILPMIDVERVIWSGSGQVLVGGSLGYMQKSAYAYLDGTTADDPFRVRSTAGRNTFRLIPFALMASYRATQLDDLWGIPVVPYLRGGLAYYIWWLKGPNGNIAKICNDGSTDIDDCDANKAIGGSLGLVGTLGMSIRAERIDADAARSMKNSGIYHAGFYVELNAGVVDGFGSDKKLSVGDTTWFAGFDFEF
jgi:MYXO-CTERM domain-containing protein